MKKSTLKTILLSSLLLFSASGFSAVPEHGSMIGKDIQMYAEGTSANPGGNTSFVRPATLNYRIVTYGNKSWAHLKFSASGGIMADEGPENAWQTQLRYWSATNEKTENNLINFKDGNSQVITGTTEASIPLQGDVTRISFFQSLTDYVFSETVIFNYDIWKPNSKDNTDTEKPVISACNISKGESSATITLTGSDNSGELYYFIEDAQNNIEEFSLSNTITLQNLNESTTFNLKIYPIDFSGNIGEAYQQSFTTDDLVQITTGIAKDIKFVVLSTETRLDYYYEFTDPNKKFHEAFIQMTPAGGSMIEIKPTVSDDRKYVYGSSTDSRIAGYSIGGFDETKIQGELTLTAGMQNDEFEAIGRGMLNIEGLPVYKDAIGGIGTPTSDHERTKINMDTTRLFMIVNAYSGMECLHETMDFSVELLKKYASATSVEVKIIGY